MSNGTKNKNLVAILQEFSIPLIIGVIVAMVIANVSPTAYHDLVHTPIHKIHHLLSQGEETHPADDVLSGAEETVETAEAHGEEHSGLDYYLTLHFLVNDIFMVLFFGIAAKEITESCLPGGALNPVKNAINPLLATLGGVLGPVGCFLLFNAFMGDPSWTKGWGIPTATDIALAWLVAKTVFGAGHPAVSFLLLLAVADDAIGLGIIAIAYPDPNHPTEWLNALLILPAMAIAFVMRKKRVMSWPAYVLICGSISWFGLYSAHLHPALALVFIVPFIPGPKQDIGMFEEEANFKRVEDVGHALGVHAHSPLELFEHKLKTTVDFGLFFFAFANAGVPFAEINNLTWIVLIALALGKTVGITLCSWVGELMGFPLPSGMRIKHLAVAGLIAGMGLTVALFVAAQAYTDPSAQGAAKMGALFSGGIALVAIILGKILGLKSRE